MGFILKAFIDFIPVFFFFISYIFYTDIPINYINEINSNLTQPEKIKKFQIINEPFSIENNLMTPTMKVRRHEVEKKYAEIINQLY